MLKKTLSATLSAALIVAATPFCATQAVAAGFQAAPRLSAAPALRLQTAVPALPAGVPGLPGSLLPAAALTRVPTAGLPSVALPSAALPLAAAAAPVAAAVAPSAVLVPESKSAAAVPLRSAAGVAAVVATVNAPKASAQTGAAAFSAFYEGRRAAPAAADDAPVDAGAPSALPALSASSGRETRAAAPAVAELKAQLAAKNAGAGAAGGRLHTVDFIYFGAMGLMLGAVLAAHAPVIGAAALAAATIGLNVWNARRGVKRVPYDLAAHENRAVAVGMVLNVLWVGATGVFALGPMLGALIAYGASVWHARRARALSKKDVADASGKDGKSGGAVGVARDLTTKEFAVLNIAGVVGSLATGLATHHALLGLLGMYVAPIPLICAYVAGARLLGHAVRWPGIRFSPGISWGGASNKTKKDVADAAHKDSKSGGAVAALLAPALGLVTAASGALAAAGPLKAVGGTVLGAAAGFALGAALSRLKMGPYKASGSIADGFGLVIWGGIIVFWGLVGAVAGAIAGSFAGSLL